MYKSNYLLRDFHPSEPLHTPTLIPAHQGSLFSLSTSLPSHRQRKWGARLCPVSLSTPSPGKIPAGQCCSYPFTHLLSLAAGKCFSTPGSWVWVLVKLKVRGQRLVCHEAEAGLGCPKGAGEPLVMGSKLPGCGSVVSVPAPSFADVVALLPGNCHSLTSSAAATRRCGPGSLPFFLGVTTTPGAVSLAGHTVLLAWFLLCTYWDLRLLNYLEKNFNQREKSPWIAFSSTSANPGTERHSHIGQVLPWSPWFPWNFVVYFSEGMEVNWLHFLSLRYIR